MICRMDFDICFGILNFELSSHHNVSYEKEEELSKGSGPLKSGLARARAQLLSMFYFNTYLSVLHGENI